MAAQRFSHRIQSNVGQSNQPTSEQKEKEVIRVLYAHDSSHRSRMQHIQQDIVIISMIFCMVSILASFCSCILRSYMLHNSQSIDNKQQISRNEFNKSLDRSKSRTVQSYTLTMARENIQNLGSSPSQNVTDIYNRTGQTVNDLNPYKMNPDLTHLNQHIGPLAYYSMHKHLSLKQHDLYRENITDINDIITAQRTVYQFCQSIITTPLNSFINVFRKKFVYNEITTMPGAVYAPKAIAILSHWPFFNPFSTPNARIPVERYLMNLSPYHIQHLGNISIGNVSTLFTALS